MTFSSNTLLAWLNRTLRYLSLALLPALVVEAGQVNLSHRGQISRTPNESEESPPPRRQGTVPYLTVVTPPMLRFRAPAAPPAFDIEPVATGPAYNEEVVTTINAAAPARTKPDVILPVATESRKEATPQGEKKELQQEVPVILPDDLRRDVRPEDLVPFFQFPKGGARIGVIVPVPPQAPSSTLPPSSASYRQQ